MLMTDGPIEHLRRRLLHENVLTFSQWQALLARIEQTGLQLTRIPERKARPDAPGLWWVRWSRWKGEQSKTVLCRVRSMVPTDGLEIRAPKWKSWEALAHFNGSNLEWAVGPIEPPEGDR